jgi:hypothetical protein
MDLIRRLPGTSDPHSGGLSSSTPQSYIEWQAAFSTCPTALIAVRRRGGWAPYFEELLRGVGFLERETSLEISVE